MSTKTTLADLKAPDPIELRDSPLGRMLAARLTLKIIGAIVKIPLEDISADNFTARFLAIVARRVPEEALATHDTYEAAVPIDAAAFAALSEDALDELVGAYLAGETASMQSLYGDRLINTLPGERQSERLLRLVKGGVEELNKSVSVFAQQFRQLQLPESLLKFPEILREAFDRTSQLTQNLKDSLSNIRSPAFELPNIEQSDNELPNSEFPYNIELPPNPIFETNSQLAKLAITVQEMVNVGRQQAELAQSLAETSRLALEQAVKSGNDASDATRQARSGVRIALAAIVLSIVTGFGTIIDNHHLTAGTDAHLVTLIDTVKPITDLQLQSVTKLEALLEASESLAKALDVMLKVQDSDQTSRHDEIEALRYLTHRIEELIQAESARNSTPNHGTR